nr:hypothetical protein Iba_chr01fCG9520 [Ipomoea batatas]
MLFISVEGGYSSHITSKSDSSNGILSDVDTCEHSGIPQPAFESIWEQGHHGGEVGLLEALDQGRVDLFLDGLAARREGTLTVHPGQLVPDLRVNEGGEELPGYGLVGVDEPSNAAGVLHLVHGLLLGLLCLVSSGLRLAEFLLGLFNSVLGGCELLLQLLNSTLGRGGLLLKRHNLLLSDAL